MNRSGVVSCPGVIHRLCSSVSQLQPGKRLGWELHIGPHPIFKGNLVWELHIGWMSHLLHIGCAGRVRRGSGKSLDHDL